MPHPERPGVLLVLSAPSGTGKSTLIQRLTAEFPHFAFSVSYTTRAPRSGEIDGREYHFVTHERFHNLAAQNHFAEWAEVHGNCYGTPRQATLDTLAAGRHLLFDIDVQGASQLKANLEQGTFVFLLPPSRAALEQRLQKRGSDDETTIRKRLENARQEITAATEFDHWIVNDDLERAYDALRAVYLAQTTRPTAQPGLTESIIATWKDHSHG